MEYQAKVERLLARCAELEQLLAQPEAFADQKLTRERGKEHAYLREVKEVWEALLRLQEQEQESQQLLRTEGEGEFAQMVREELEGLSAQIAKQKQQLELLLVPPDPNDSRPIIVELRAGTGGEEAALFVSDCLRMYRFYADKKGWKVEPLSCSLSDKGGCKEYIFSLSGPQVHRLMQYEAGTHRVQRVPETEAQGRVHTSAITVAVLLEPSEEEEVFLQEKDLRVDTYRSSGAGGQHVNTTDSAVRITHLPSGIVVYCQEERSQHKNKEKAMRLLKAKIAEEVRRKESEATASMRSQQVGTGDRSERIRTYNFPQNRVTDHRIDLTLYSLDRVMEGELDPLTSALVQHFYQERLTS